MPLRDPAEAVVVLDDELRSLANQLNRAVDRLQRRLREAGLDDPRADLSGGILEGPACQAGGALEALDALMHGWACGRLVRPEDGGQVRRTVSLVLDLSAQAGRVRGLLDRRDQLGAELEAAWQRAREVPEVAELVEVVFGARRAAADRACEGSVSFLHEVQLAAGHDAELGRLDDAQRRLRAAIAEGRDVPSLGAEVGSRLEQAARKLALQGEEADRRLADLAARVARQQELAHGLFQSVTKASEVLGLAAELRAANEREGLPDGALGRLKAACIEHGVTTLLLELRRLAVERTGLDRAVQELSEALGDLFVAVADRPHLVQRLARLWDDLALADAGAIERDFDRTYAHILGVTVEGEGVLSMKGDALLRLACADGLDAWLRLLVAAVEDKLGAVDALVHGLEEGDAVLSELLDDARAGAAARRTKRALASFVGEVAHALDDYYSRVHATLHEPNAGFRRVQAQVRAFAHASAVDASTSAEARREAFGATLAEVERLFAELEATLPLELGGEEWHDLERASRARVVEAHRAAALSSARSRRLRDLILPDLPPACAEALRLAGLRPAAADGSPGAGWGSADSIGEALEALHLEAQLLAAMQLPPGDPRHLERHRRAMAGRRIELEATIAFLTFRLLGLAGDEFDGLAAAERPAHLDWMDGLLTHAADGLGGLVELLDQALGELPAPALERAYRTVFDAYHAWASVAAESEALAELAQRGAEPWFRTLEHRLAAVGQSVLSSNVVDSEAWRDAGALRALAELARGLEGPLADRPTLTDVAGAIAEAGRRAGELAREAAAEGPVPARGTAGRRRAGGKG